MHSSVPAHNFVIAGHFDDTVSLGISDERVVRVLTEVAGGSILRASSDSVSLDVNDESCL